MPGVAPQKQHSTNDDVFVASLDKGFVGSVASSNLAMPCLASTFWQLKLTRFRFCCGKCRCLVCVYIIHYIYIRIYTYHSASSINMYIMIVNQIQVSTTIYIVAVYCTVYIVNYQCRNYKYTLYNKTIYIYDYIYI